MCIRDRSNSSLPRTITAELSDVSDIAHAANSSLGQLLGCVANARPGRGSQVLEGFQRALPQMPITVGEMAGEWPFFNLSISCVGSTSTPLRYSSGASRASVLPSGVLTISAVSYTHLTLPTISSVQISPAQLSSYKNSIWV
eukprot:TRINITY_DN1144_c0_g1_i1.p1 TRINITY_DN1144_c0_g1~~TRINITY_DN1144_c0_g1_i1.p1  ORF type:complete len:142 (-),score=32.75 TRINITY_DN1144_c0_g1_i1:11-436(-)